jgi:hypothetical protein
MVLFNRCKTIDLERKQINAKVFLVNALRRTHIALQSEEALDFIGA